MKKESIWHEEIKNENFIELKNNLDVDILIVGGGITGLSTAYNLIDSNMKVALVERNIVGSGVTCRTTGKLTYLQENIYSKLVNNKGLECAREYLESQKEAIKIVKDIIAINNIDCNYNDVLSFVFTNEEKNINKLKKEKEILEKLGIQVEENKLDKVLYSICVTDTGVFHPIKYLNQMKEICQKNGIDIYENTKVVNINKYKNCYMCKTESNYINAKYVVLALHYPYFLFPFLMPLKTHLEKSYIAAYKAEKNLYYSSINIDNNTISTRYHEDKDIYKIFLTNSHNIAFDNNDINNFKSLKKYLPKDPDYLWSNKDIITGDKLPYIGLLDDNLYIGAGYNTWGMTNGTIAGKIISDKIKGINNKYENLFNPKRTISKDKLLNFPIDIGSNIKSFVGSKLNKNKSWYSNQVIFENINGIALASYIDKENEKHTIYNKCPHLKCSLIFNEEELTWDCPCHGSRFDVDGKCIEGPSNYDISYKE